MSDMVTLDPDKLGQHLLVNKERVKDIIRATRIQPHWTVLEIGPGLGVLTERLCERANRVIAVEKDRQFAGHLSLLEKRYPQLRVQYRDILQGTLPQVDTIVGSIPFHITEPLIEKLIRSEVDRVTFVVGQRFYWSLRKRVTTKLSLLTRSYFRIYGKGRIPKTAFSPIPRTAAYIIVMIRRPKKSLPFSLYVMRELFEQRDKLIKNALREAFIRERERRNAQMTKRQATALIEALGVRDEVIHRYLESLPNEDIASIFRSLVKVGRY